MKNSVVLIALSVGVGLSACNEFLGRVQSESSAVANDQDGNGIPVSALASAEEFARGHLTKVMTRARKNPQDLSKTLNTQFTLYDQRGRAMTTASVTNYNNESRTFVSGSRFDTANRVFSANYPSVISDTGGNSKGYTLGPESVATYNASGALEHVAMIAKDSAGKKHEITADLVYDALGHMTKSTYENKIDTVLKTRLVNEQDYPASNQYRLHEIVSTREVPTHAEVMRFTYAHNDIDNIKSLSGRVGITEVSWQYCYDTLSRLTVAAAKEIAVVTCQTRKKDYDYAANGNFIKKPYKNPEPANTSPGLEFTAAALASPWVAPTPEVTIYNYGSPLQPHAAQDVVTQDSFGGETKRHYVYDNVGSVIQEIANNSLEAEYQHSPRGPMTYAAEASSWVHYFYSGNGEGRRILKESSNGDVTYYSSNLNTIIEPKDSGVTAYLFNQAVEFNSKNGVFYTMRDHLGSAGVRMSGTTGEIVNSSLYGPYGETYNTARASAPRFGYTGQEAISELGDDLYHYNARSYNVKSGTFLTADNIVSDPTDPQSWNRYSYVGNNPIMNTDPSGHCKKGGEGTENCPFVIDEPQETTVTKPNTSTTEPPSDAKQLEKAVETITDSYQNEEDADLAYSKFTDEGLTTLKNAEWVDQNGNPNFTTMTPEEIATAKRSPQVKRFYFDNSPFESPKDFAKRKQEAEDAFKADPFNTTTPPIDNYGAAFVIDGRERRLIYNEKIYTDLSPGQRLILTAFASGVAAGHPYTVVAQKLIKFANSLPSQ